MFLLPPHALAIDQPVSGNASARCENMAVNVALAELFRATSGDPAWNPTGHDDPYMAFAADWHLLFEVSAHLQGALGGVPGDVLPPDSTLEDCNAGLRRVLGHLRASDLRERGRYVSAFFLTRQLGRGTQTAAR